MNVGAVWRDVLPMNPKTQPLVPQPSASVILLRESVQTLEVLLVRRHERLAAHGGAWVFPGGKVDAADAADGDVHDMETARRTAVREVREETCLELNPAGLRPFSHWTTSLERPRRFANWFFVSAVDAESAVQVDGREIVDARWLSPADALAARDEGEIVLPPPTFINLQTLTQVPTMGALTAFFARHAVERFNPKIIKRADGEVALYEGDAGYDTLSLDAPGPRHRLYMLTSGWRYEREG
jgi:8-oxo-dGTP pyrophosphatase MutT (NUDIX family)